MNLLSVQALLAMGLPHPATGEVAPPNAEIARFYVDLITVLKDKTEGNRTEAESRELEDMLFQLRMRAMNVQSAAPGMPGAPGR